MTGHSSDRVRHIGLRVVDNERGAVLIFVTLLMLSLVGVSGVALDLGHRYLRQVRMSRAVDAGALAAARSLRQGQMAAQSEAEAVARANGIANSSSVTTSIEFGFNERGESTVVFGAFQTLPTVFLRAMGIHQMSVAAEAEAAIPPLDIVLVLDTSGSLDDADAFDDLQGAAETFVEYFSDTVDQMGLVSFQIKATNLVNLKSGFTADIVDEIGDMESNGDTNIGEGLRLARLQITGGSARPSAAKAVVFFTDGVASAVRGIYGQDRILAVSYVVGNGIRGYFNSPDALAPFATATASGCGGGPSSCNVPGYGTLSEAQIRTMAKAEGLAQADALRSAGILIYSIGLGDVDLPYLRQVANEAGVVNTNQPEGKTYYTPNAAQLEAVFREVANDLVVRLAR